MADLIDRQAAIEWFIHKENELFEKTSPRIRPTFANGIARALAKLPTVDAVEVVRCKDCIHWYGREGVCLKIYSDGNVNADAWQERKAEDFCSYGERMAPNFCPNCGADMRGERR